MLRCTSPGLDGVHPPEGRVALAQRSLNLRWEMVKWGFKGQSLVRDVKLDACVKYCDLSKVDSRSLMGTAVCMPWKLNGINEHEIDGVSHARTAL